MSASQMMWLSAGSALRAVGSMPAMEFIWLMRKRSLSMEQGNLRITGSDVTSCRKDATASGKEVMDLAELQVGLGQTSPIRRRLWPASLVSQCLQVTAIIIETIGGG